MVCSISGCEQESGGDGFSHLGPLCPMHMQRELQAMGRSWVANDFRLEEINKALEQDPEIIWDYLHARKRELDSEHSNRNSSR